MLNRILNLQRFGKAGGTGGGSDLYWRAMGVEYKVWIVPHQRTFRPTAEQVASLANSLCESGWVPKQEVVPRSLQISELLPGNSDFGEKPGWAKEMAPGRFTPDWVAFHSQRELVVRWRVNNMLEAGVQYPSVFLNLL